MRMCVFISWIAGRTLLVLLFSDAFLPPPRLRHLSPCCFNTSVPLQHVPPAGMRVPACSWAAALQSLPTTPPAPLWSPASCGYLPGCSEHWTELLFVSGDSGNMHRERPCSLFCALGSRFLRPRRQVPPSLHSYSAAGLRTAPRTGSVRLGSSGGSGRSASLASSASGAPCSPALTVPVLPGTLWPCLPVKWTHPDSPGESHLHSSSGQWGGRPHRKF